MCIQFSFHFAIHNVLSMSIRRFVWAAMYSIWLWMTENAGIFFPTNVMRQSHFFKYWKISTPLAVRFAHVYTRYGKSLGMKKKMGGAFVFPYICMCVCVVSAKMDMLEPMSLPDCCVGYTANLCGSRNCSSISYPSIHRCIQNGHGSAKIFLLLAATFFIR